MTEYADLTPYRYQTEWLDWWRRLGLRNVGWLGRQVPFATGDTPVRVRDALVRLADEPVEVMRGFHACELCRRKPPIYVDAVDGSDEQVMLGTGEIRVWGRLPRRYAAPTLIVHYIDEHRYMPPREFCDAVLRVADRHGWP
ncbi:hypothetical protein CS0771_45010 [Catellatospora sp. IY07-71]|uniref:DUF7919 family protein n=1 Tax=Catellatospora sp. IY07-71 TaxID=2728827 RepID=UPI001BB3D13E|nr:hypothetical protein [Catellatospora sp. IY07-71]BCJ74957.1 hypothetical protein CS0771_45010 [Catellatospora sp. IY07-71]